MIHRMKPEWPAAWRVLAGLVLVLLVAGGCSRVSDHLTIRADGTGEVVLEVTMEPTLQEYAAMREMRGTEAGPALAYPPMSEDDARTLFPEGVFELKTEQLPAAEGGGATTRYTAAFSDANAMLTSPYGQAHALSITLDKGTNRLTVRGVTGLGGAAAAQTMKPGAMSMGMPISSEQVRKLNEAFRAEFRITLPGTPEAEGAAIDGNTAAWVFDAKERGAGEPMADALRGVMQATCSAEGVAFDPRPSGWMGSTTFAELEEGETQAAADAPPAERVLAAAKFVPVRIRVQRTIDYTGESYAGEDGTTLTGVVTLPRELAPQRFGEPKLLEATSASGKNLMPSDDGHHFRRHFASHAIGSVEAGDKAEVTHVVQLTMGLPEYSDTSLSHIRAEVPLSYGGGIRTVKVENAIAAEAISSGGNMSFSMNWSDLPVEGAQVKTMGAMRQNGMTIIMLQSEGEAALVDVQVYDAAGRPWPTITMNQGGGGGSRMLQVVAVGEPQGPLSLGVRIQGAGGGVKLPIELENVALTD